MTKDTLKAKRELLVQQQKQAEVIFHKLSGAIEGIDALILEMDTPDTKDTPKIKEPLKADKVK